MTAWRVQPEGINQFLYNHLRNVRLARAFGLGDLDRSENDNVWAFLRSPGFDDRKGHAMRIVRFMVQSRGKVDPFYRVLEQINNIEEGTQRFNRDIRDHISHSVYVYLLGIVFIEKLASQERSRLSFRWTLASLLHDFGNPPHLLGDSLRNFLSATEPHVTPEHTQIGISFAFEGLETLKRREGKPDNGFEYIQNRLASWGLGIDIKDEFNRKLQDGKIDHGVLGALLVLRSIDMLYSTHNPDDIETDQELRRVYEPDIEQVGWGRNHFDEEIVDACAAISLHNLVEDIPNLEISYENSRLAFLLILCDTIQEWDRFSPGQRVYDPHSVSIDFQDDLPHITLSVSTSKIRRIRNIINKLSIHGERIPIN